MGAHLHQTKIVRGILKSCGFIRGEYRISTTFNRQTKGYNRTYIFMRKPTTAEQIESLIKAGLSRIYDTEDIYPIFKY